MTDPRTIILTSLALDDLIRQAKRAIRLHGTPITPSMGYIRCVVNDGVTVVWNDDYEDGVFKIILRGHFPAPCVLIRERWVNRKLTVDVSQFAEEAIPLASAALRRLTILEDLASV